MSVKNWILDKTVGGWWDILTDTVNPWKLADIKAQTDADIARASNVVGKPVVASAKAVADRQKAAKAEVEGYLKSQGQHPDQANWDTALDRLRTGIILVAAVGLGVYILVQFGKAYLSRR